MPVATAIGLEEITNLVEYDKLMETIERTQAEMTGQHAQSRKTTTRGET